MPPVTDDLGIDSMWQPSVPPARRSRADLVHQSVVSVTLLVALTMLTLAGALLLAGDPT